MAVGEPARHQVEELPPITVRVIEHRAQRLRCPECAQSARARELPPRLPGAPLVRAFKRRWRRCRCATVSLAEDAVELVEELFGARISSGTVDAILSRAAKALAEPHEDLLERLRSGDGAEHG